MRAPYSYTQEKKKFRLQDKLGEDAYPLWQQEREERLFEEQGEKRRKDKTVGIEVQESGRAQGEIKRED